MRRKEELVTGEVYHIFNKSIAGFKIFNNDNEFVRMRNLLKFYQIEEMQFKFSRFIEQFGKENFNKDFHSVSQGKKKLVEIIAYCLMPTHFHLIIKQLKENAISLFMRNILNSYSLYFNLKHKRKGHLWESRFRNALIDSDEQLLHLTRYIHLNPVTAYLVNNPEEWLASSYLEYLLKVEENDRMCKYNDILDIEPNTYRNFVNDRISYQRELAKIKQLLIDE